jgi:hypothetical protein
LPVLVAGCNDQSTAAVRTGETFGVDVAMVQCARCHDPGDGSFSGARQPVMGIYPPNLTPDSDTGIGDWTDDDIITAIRTGVDDQGKTLCEVMPRFVSLTQSDMAGLVKFLRGLPPVQNQVPDGHCPGEE